MFGVHGGEEGHYSEPRKFDMYYKWYYVKTGSNFLQYGNI
jgi:hypothetical protein